MHYYIKVGFTCLTDEEIGEIQSLKIDQGWTVAELARTFKVSRVTVYKAIKAIPASQVKLAKKWALRLAS